MALSHFIRFWNPIEVTDPQLLQRNMAKISLTRYLEYCEPYKENMAKLSLARNFQVSLCQANNILEHTGNFLMISMTL
jgi:hypothetical protein